MARGTPGKERQVRHAGGGGKSGNRVGAAALAKHLGKVGQIPGGQPGLGDIRPEPVDQ